MKAWHFEECTKFVSRTRFEKETIYRRAASHGMRNVTTTKDTAPCDSPECPALLAIEIIGSELKLSVLHSLMSGPKRFNELRVLAAMCQSSLAKTLKELEDSGLAERRVLLERPVAVEYHLSEMGDDLSDAIEGLEHWARKWVVGHRTRKVHA